uniref:C2H2-type domain-containing protein n=1 Tax=Heterorhabditis bacteriophora TaxID=37862 RepID=A0A1I7WTS7_HETBA
MNACLCGFSTQCPTEFLAHVDEHDRTGWKEIHTRKNEGNTASSERLATTEQAMPFSVSSLMQSTSIFKVPSSTGIAKLGKMAQDQPEDLSLPSHDRMVRSHFHTYIERQQREGRCSMACPSCLLVFTDSLMYRIHLSAHAPGHTWRCSGCGTICNDRVSFQRHLIDKKHG